MLMMQVPSTYEILYLWSTRPLWWDYEGTNFCVRGTNMLKMTKLPVDFQGSDSDRIYECLDSGAIAIASVREFRVVSVDVVMYEKYMTYEFLDEEDTTGLDRKREYRIPVLIAVCDSPDDVIRWFPIGVFSSADAAYDAVMDLNDNVLSEANNGVITSAAFAAWVERNDVYHSHDVKRLLNNRQCPIDENINEYQGRYYGDDIRTFPPNYTVVHDIDGGPDTYLFVGSDVPKIRNVDTGEVYDAPNPDELRGNDNAKTMVHSEEPAVPAVRTATSVVSLAEDTLYPPEFNRKVNEFLDGEK